MFPPARLILTLTMLAAPISAVHAAPVLRSVFPAGGQAGGIVEVQVIGDGLTGLQALRCNHPGVEFKQQEGDRFVATIAADTPPGLYDVQAICSTGVSSTRTFFVTRRRHLAHPTGDEAKGPSTVAMDSVISDRIAKGGEVDQFRVQARAGQRVVVECWADRIDSSLRAVLEVEDERGKQLASNRGFFGVDPALSFVAPRDGTYEVRVYDLVYSGGANHFYRLDIGVGPRLVLAVPSVLQRGVETDVELIGWNLGQSNESKSAAAGKAPMGMGSRRMRVAAPSGRPVDRVRLQPSQAVIDGFAFDVEQGDAPILLALSDAPVLVNRSESGSPESAQPLSIPGEACGRFQRDVQRHWYALDAKHGEVIHVEAFGERIGAPVDLAIALLDESGGRELASFHDQKRNIGGLRFPSAHLDPSGRWVAPADGRYLLLVRNLFSGAAEDPRRAYRLRVSRAKVQMTVVAVARTDAPRGVNLQPGGREVLELLALERGGFQQSIRVAARNLPRGVKCSDAWIGPGVDRAPLVLTAEEGAAPFVGSLDLIASTEVGGVQVERPVRAGIMVRSGLPNGRGRVAAETVWSVRSKSPLILTATAERKRYQQGSIVDVELHVERQAPEHKAELKLKGFGLPSIVRNQRAAVAGGEHQGGISFYLPPHTPPGRYSLVVQADTTALLPADAPRGKQKPGAVTAFSNPVNIEVYPAPFVLEVDLDAPRKIQRGKIIQLKYKATRMNGFIGKMHTDLAAAGKVVGLRARGVTFVGQTESGTLQIIANENAPLGQQPFLRLEAVGTVEDEPVYLGACFLQLEIVE